MNFHERKKQKKRTMSRSKYTNECSVPHQRGRKQILKGKRLTNKRIRRLPIETDQMTLKRTQKSVELDKDPPILSDFGTIKI